MVNSDLRIPKYNEFLFNVVFLVYAKKNIMML